MDDARVEQKDVVMDDVSAVQWVSMVETSEDR